MKSSAAKSWLDIIYSTAKLVSDDELTRLRLEEELLVNFARKQGINLETKTQVFQRIKEINREQLRILGE